MHARGAVYTLCPAVVTNIGIDGLLDIARENNENVIINSFIAH